MGPLTAAGFLGAMSVDSEIDGAFFLIYLICATTWRKTSERVKRGVWTVDECTHFLDEVGSENGWSSQQCFFDSRRARTTEMRQARVKYKEIYLGQRLDVKFRRQRDKREVCVECVFAERDGWMNGARSRNETWNFLLVSGWFMRPYISAAGSSRRSTNLRSILRHLQLIPAHPHVQFTHDLPSMED